MYKNLSCWITFASILLKWLVFPVRLPSSDGARLWQALSDRIRPAGFAAIDSLRIEAGFMLFTNDLVLAPTISELGVNPGAAGRGENDRFEFICLWHLMAMTLSSHPPV